MKTFIALNHTIFQKILFCTLFIGLCWIGLSGQKAFRKQAEEYFNANNYYEALQIYNNIASYIADDSKALIHKGISHYKCNEPDSCIRSMERAFALKATDPEIYLYTARSYQALGNYSDAAVFYKNYLKNGSADLQSEVVNELYRCEFSRKLVFKEQKAYVENFGDKVNSRYNEINPVQSPNFQNRYYFSSNREISTGGPRNSEGKQDEIAGIYAYDMFGVELEKGNWVPIFPFNAMQNSIRNETIEDFSKDGQVMYYSIEDYKGNRGIYADTFYLTTEERAFPKPLISDYHPEKGDKDFTAVSDSIVLFSSSRNGGYGGYDLYLMLKIEGQWTPAINLGKEVNGPFNEINPYVTIGGNELYFSSDRLEGLGGFDIYYSTFNADKNRYEIPENMAAPVNSPGNDVWPMISGDGNQMVFSSDRVGGYGGYDLHIAYLKNQVIDQISYAEVPLFIDVMLHPRQPKDSLHNQELPSPLKEKARTTFLANNLYYTSDANLLSPQNLSSISALADVMILFPNLKVTLSGHSTIDNQPMFCLFFSIKRVEKILEILVKKGVNQERIKCFGYGASFPMIKAGSAEKLNNRIEILIQELDKNALTVVYDQPNINDNLKSNAILKYQEVREGVNFRIKVGKTSQILKYDILNNFGYSTIVKNTDGTYTYYISIIDNYGLARTLKNDLISQGILDAEIEVFYNGEVATKAQIALLAEDNQEMREYLKFQGN